MRLQEFHDLVSAELKRGDSLNAVIPARVKMAVQFLERNHACKHMETWFNLRVEPNEQVVTFPWSFRNIKTLRGTKDGRYFYLDKTRLEDEPYGTEDAITGWQQIGFEAIRFNSKPTKDTDFEGLLYKFTDWQTTQPDFRHFLLDNATDLLLYQSLFAMGVYLRDQRMLGFYKPLRDEALKSFFVMDDDAAEGGYDDAMVYRGLR